MALLSFFHASDMTQAVRDTPVAMRRNLAASWAQISAVDLASCFGRLGFPNV